MDDLVTCHECGAAMPSGQQSRHREWHARVTQDLQNLQRRLQQAEANVQAVDAGVQRVGAAVQTHRH